MTKMNLRCEECGFRCKMLIDLENTVLPMRIKDDASIPGITCPFDVLFWPEQKPIWRIFGNVGKESNKS
jgi:hypothetical protein